MEIQIVKFFQSMSSNFLDSFFSLYTKLGEGVFFAIMFLILYWCVNEKNAFKFCYLYFISVGINSICKSIFARPRPYMSDSTIMNKLPASGLSFPSGHSQSFGAIATFANINVYRNKSFKKSFKIMFTSITIVLGIFLGISRMYLGQHYLTDVLAGFILGIGIVYLLDYLLRLIPDKIKNIFTLKKLLLITNVIITISTILVLLLNILNAYHLTQFLEYGSMFVGASAGYYLLDKLIPNKHNISLNKQKSILFNIGKSVFGICFIFGVGILLYSILPNTNIFLILTNLILSFIATFVLPYLFQKVIPLLNKNMENNIENNSK